jgi:small subunit ribosomal protein S20
MAHSKQAFKRARQSERKRIVNKVARSRVKNAIKQAHTAASEARPEALSAAMKRIDKAAKIRAIHANAAARYKSRLAKALNKAKAAGT